MMIIDGPLKPMYFSVGEQSGQGVAGAEVSFPLTSARAHGDDGPIYYGTPAGLSDAYDDLKGPARESA